MMMQIVSMQQIVITAVFLSCLIGLLIFLRMKGGSIRANLQKGQRIRVIEETAVSTAERLHLITIDGCEFVMLSGKGIQPSLVRLSTAETKAHTSTPSKHGSTDSSQAPLELTSPAFPREGEQATEAASPLDSHPNQMAPPQMDTSQINAGEVAAFAAKFKGWRKN